MPSKPRASPAPALEARRSRTTRRAWSLAAAAFGFVVLGRGGVIGQAPASGTPDLTLFFKAATQDGRDADEALDRLAAAWRDGYAAIIVDMARLMRPASRQTASGAEEAASRFPDDDTNPGLGPPGVGGRGDFDSPAFRRQHPSTIVRRRLTRFLEKQTGKRFGDDLGRWREWMWNLPYEPHPEYAAFKGVLYGQLDPKMQAFFPPGVRATIRLDEIDWGGVPVNGIPPLDHPKNIPAAEASYLKDDHLVFGIAVNGEARAYPKRILAWHEMAHDRVGGVELTIVYCTLCGTVIPYEATVGGERRRFGTSGLLYRSNKLMFDEESKSLWSTFEGEPVVGSLVDSGLQLRSHSVVTTTWGEWRSEHPETTVLSLDTGFDRDYSEGAAYRDYFSTDRLMFGVPKTDDRLKNKAEVLVMLLQPTGGGGERTPLAISADFLKRNTLYHAEAVGRRLVVVTSPKGANRVYDAGSERFVKQLDDDLVQDASGRRWKVTEEALVGEADASLRHPRVAAQRAFWFGWYAQFPKTILIK